MLSQALVDEVVSRSSRSTVREVRLSPPLVCATAFEAHREYIGRVLRRCGASDVDAEDLAQEVFLVMWRRWLDYDHSRPLRPWLAGIASRVAFNHRDRGDREVPAGLIDREDEAPDPEQDLGAARARAAVRKALGRLTEKQRAVLVMHEIDSVPMRDVAALLAIPLFTAYSRLRAARREFGKSGRLFAMGGRRPARARKNPPEGARPSPR
jgi:RNA polymerase sigma-70 factor (ECF subfamily)